MERNISILYVQNFFDFFPPPSFSLILLSSGKWYYEKVIPLSTDNLANTFQTIQRTNDRLFWKIMFGLSVGGTGTRKSPTYLGRVKYVRREDCEFAEIACESMGGSRLITRGFFSSRLNLKRQTIAATTLFFLLSFSPRFVRRRGSLVHSTNISKSKSGRVYSARLQKEILREKSWETRVL